MVGIRAQPRLLLRVVGREAEQVARWPPQGHLLLVPERAHDDRIGIAARQVARHDRGAPHDDVDVLGLEEPPCLLDVDRVLADFLAAQDELDAASADLDRANAIARACSAEVCSPAQERQLRAG